MKTFSARLWHKIMLLIIVPFLGAQIVTAQDNPFAPAIIVNGMVITNYELTQRIIFFSLLQPNADATTEARNSLIDDRLRQSVAEALGVEVSPDDLAAGMDAFAGRANLTADQFIKALAPRGVAPETFRDFVKAGLLWRETIRAKFLPSTTVSEKQIDRAIAGGMASGGELKLLLSEIVLKKGGTSDPVQLAERIKGDVTTAAGFSAAARLNSTSPSAARGGILDWLLLSDLPPEIAAKVALLEPDQMTDPIQTGDTVVLFFLRDRSSVQGEAAGALAVDYLRFGVAAGTDTAKMTADVDRCEDLLPFGRNLPEEAILRETIPESAVPAGLAATLRGLDAGETAVITTAAGQTEVVMLCSRLPLSDIPASRDDVRSQLLNQRMALHAQSYLEELRAEAFIIAP